MEIDFSVPIDKRTIEFVEDNFIAFIEFAYIAYPAVIQSFVEYYDTDFEVISDETL